MNIGGNKCGQQFFYLELVSLSFPSFVMPYFVIVLPLFVIPASLCNFFASFCNFWAAPLCNYATPLCNHKKLPHFVIIGRINLGMFLYIFDNLAIFPRKFNHGQDDRRILNFRSLTVEKSASNSRIINICISV